MFESKPILFSYMYTPFPGYSKTCVKRLLSKDRKLVFKANYPFMQVKSSAECSKGSILQYFRPSLSYHWSLRYLFCLFLSVCFTQVLAYKFVQELALKPCKMFLLTNVVCLLHLLHAFKCTSGCLNHGS